MTDNTIGIAFGGGGARGLSHIWVMEALDELGLKPVALSGTSIGALAAVCYASGITGAELRAYMLEVFGNRNEVLSRFWRSRPKKFSELSAFHNPLGSWAQLDPEWIAETFLPPAVHRDFSQLAIRTSFSATEYYTGNEVIMNEGDTYKAVAASMAIPALFRPVEYDGRLLVDGGCVNPMPVDHVRPHADIIIAVDVIGVPQKTEDGKLRVFEMGFGASQLLMQTIQREKMRHDEVELLVHPHIGNFRPLDFLKTEEILAASEDTKEDVKRRLTALMEAGGTTP
ncbi:patatin-like phospholipase family protein [Cohaesibacter celericrescens]|uniref:Patatin n=1 Tax=Cohaesibacter celericrescens TaxID=2067669 RepID=A0A2N5XKS6_9HYPH|nr:patatin-like phospholipase family protein [Cohaesibacter celericrescens]PLW75040.1 Patatin [Cohaesibacter celericrescens]